MAVFALVLTGLAALGKDRRDADIGGDGIDAEDDDDDDGAGMVELGAGVEFEAAAPRLRFPVAAVAVDCQAIGCF